MKHLCENCKQEVNDSQNFCNHCGSEFLNDAVESNEDLYARIRESLDGPFNKGSDPDIFNFPGLKPVELGYSLDNGVLITFDADRTPDEYEKMIKSKDFKAIADKLKKFGLTRKDYPKHYSVDFTYTSK